jgi:hypothetical protein
MQSYLCENCKKTKPCGLMSVQLEGGKGSELQRICGDCWDEVFAKKSCGITKQKGGRRVIRGTDSLT